MSHIIGITGGIASGKSTVVKMICEAGYQVIDADKLVHDLQKRWQALPSLASALWQLYPRREGRA